MGHTEHSRQADPGERVQHSAGAWNRQKSGKWRPSYILIHGDLRTSTWRGERNILEEDADTTPDIMRNATLCY